MRRQSYIAAIGAVVASIGCSSAEPEKLGSSELEVQGGTADPANNYPFAVGVSAGGICSGALVTPNMVLTARHCVSQVNPEVDCATAVFGGLNVGQTGVRITTRRQMGGGQTTTSYRSKKIILPTTNRVCGHDVAIIILDKNVPDAEAKPIEPLLHVPAYDARFSRKTTVIGFGATSAGGGGAGTRRIRENIDTVCVSGAPEASFDCMKMQTQASESHANDMVIKEGVCSGDSGSSLYEQGSFDKWKAGQGTPLTMGILSRGLNQGSTCVNAVYTRTDAHKDMIIAAAKEAATAGGYPPPAWVNPPAGGDDAGTGADSGTGGKPDSGGIDPNPDDPKPDPKPGSDKPDNGAQPTTNSAETGSESGCSIARGGSSFGALALGAVAAMLIRRRRRS